MKGLLNGRQIIEITDPMARNIISLRVSQDLFDDLSGDPEEQAAAVRSEIATKPPQYQSQQPIIDRPFEESEWYTAIEFPFENWQRSRYSDGRFGVWYGAPRIEATVHETVYHWRQALQDAEGFEREGVSTERKVYYVDCQAALIDLRPALREWPALIHPTDYGLTQALGRRLHREGHPGVYTRSARCEEDICAILTPAVLSNPRVACYLTYTYTGGTVRVSRNRAEEWMLVP